MCVCIGGGGGGGGGGGRRKNCLCLSYVACLGGSIVLHDECSIDFNEISVLCIHLLYYF